jgi:hypothetical protein
VNARIDEASVRIRLLVADVVRLAEEGMLECKLGFQPGSAAYWFRVEVAAVPETIADFSDGRLTVKIPAGFTAEWPVNDEIGVHTQCGNVRVTVEKDLRRLKPWRAESSDAERYPNPRARKQAEPN